MASKIKIGPNKWKIRWKDYQMNTRPSKTIIGTKSQAEELQREKSNLESQLRDGFIVDRINMDATIDSLEQWFLGSKNNRGQYNGKGLRWKNAKREKPIKHKTILQYKRAFINFKKVFGDTYLIASLSSRKYRSALSDRKLSGLNVNIRSMVAMINTATRHPDKIISEVPSTLFIFQTNKPSPKYLESNQVAMIRSLDLNKHYEGKPYDFDTNETMRIFNLYLETGCRLNELLSLTWGNVNFSKKYLVIYEGAKSDKRRIVYLTSLAMRLLMEVSGRPRPMPYTNTKVRQRLNDLVKLSEIPFTTHTLRKTCGAFMLTAGASIEAVADHLGHEDIQTTRSWYARILESGLRSAVEKLDKFSNNINNQNIYLQDSN
jgi:integrase